jgi:glucose/arabinose dehydrogenase
MSSFCLSRQIERSRAVRTVQVLALASMLAIGCGGSEDNGNAGAGVAAGGGGGTTGGVGGATGGAGGVAGAMASGGAGGVGGATGGVGGGGVGGVATGGVGGMTGGAGGMAGGSGGMGGGGPATACGMPTQNATVGNTCAGSAPPALKLTMIVSGLSSPTYVTQAPGDNSRLYVLEQGGTIKIVKDGALQATPLMDLDGILNAAGLGFYTEAGLLGMVFDPNFETTKRFWVSYSRGGSYEMVVMEYTMDNPDMVAPGGGTEVIAVPQFSFNHKGGNLAFGKDGCLYFGTGDGGNEGDPTGTGQGTNDNLSVMLRIDPDNPSTPPPGNLSGHIWSTGLRNPWRFSFDRETGDLYIGDVGQDGPSGFEEVNVEPRGVSGRNYGWSDAEGSTICSGNCDSFTVPAAEYNISSARNSVIGGYVYRGSMIPALVGRYIYADWTERKIKSFIYSGEADGQPTVCDEMDTNLTVGQKVRSFGEDNDGNIYVLAAGSGTGLSGGGLNEAGFLYRIDAM